MNNQNLYHFFDSLSPSDEQKEKMLAEILKKGEKTMKRTIKISMTAVAAVAICVLTSIAALAATFNWHEKLTAFLKPTPQQMEHLQGASARPQASVTNNGVTVNVLQTLTDRHGIYVLYEVIAPEGTELTKDSRFQLSSLDYDFEKSTDTGFGTEGSKVIAADGNQMQMLLYSSCTGKITDQTITLTLCDLGDIKGDWTLSWELNYVDLTKEIAVNQPVHVNETNQNVITNVYVSPMSIHMYVQGDDVLMALHPTITYRDGSQIQLDAVNNFNTSYIFSNFLEGDNRKGTCVIGYRFDRITDLDELESVTIGDVTVPFH